MLTATRGGRDEDVPGLHVAVHEAAVVRGVEGIGRAREQAERALGVRADPRAR